MPDVRLHGICDCSFACQQGVVPQATKQRATSHATTIRIVENVSRNQALRRVVFMKLSARTSLTESLDDPVHVVAHLTCDLRLSPNVVPTVRGVLARHADDSGCSSARRTE